MNKFATSALALTVASGLSFAGSESEEWAGLDRDIENLASSVAPQGGGFTVGGFLTTTYDNSSDLADLGGFSVNNARVNMSGSVGDYGVFISFDAGADPTGVGAALNSSGSGTGSATVLDAYGTFRIGDQVTGRMGMFRAPFLWSAGLDEDKFVLLSRTFNGGIWANRDTGVMFNGTFSQIGWYVAGQNGSDSVTDDLSFTGRVDFDVLGSGIGESEGAYGSTEESNLTIGAAYHDDGALADGAAIGFDAAFTVGAFSAQGELVDYDTSFVGGVFDPLAVGGVGDTTPFSITGSFMVSPEEYEIAVRFEDLDDSASTSRITVGVNRYITGHDAKWGLNYSTSDSDTSTLEADVVSIGLTLSV